MPEFFRLNIFRLLPALLLYAAMSGCSPSGDQIPVVGILEWERLELITESSEPINRIDVYEGEQVKVGQSLLQQDAQRAQSDLDAALAAQQQAEAKLQELLAGPRKEDIAEAKAALEAARVAFQLTMAEYARVKKLHQEKLVSPEALDKAESEQRSSKASLALKQARLDKLLHGTRAEQLVQARADVASMVAKVRHLQINLKRLTITAPRDGRIDSLPFIVGEQPPPSSVVAVMLVGDTPYARVYVPEQMRAGIRPGSRAEVRLDGIDKTFAGRVRMISRDPSFTPYYSLTTHDRSRLAYLAKVDLLNAQSSLLSTGTPLQVIFSDNVGNGVNE